MKLPISIVRSIAVEASADPRSVQRILSGVAVRGMADARIRAVLAKRGLAPHEVRAPSANAEVPP